MFDESKAGQEVQVLSSASSVSSPNPSDETLPFLETPSLAGSEGQAATGIKRTISPVDEASTQRIPDMVNGTTLEVAVASTMQALLSDVTEGT